MRVIKKKKNGVARRVPGARQSAKRDGAFWQRPWWRTWRLDDAVLQTELIVGNPFRDSGVVCLRVLVEEGREEACS